MQDFNRHERELSKYRAYLAERRVEKLHRRQKALMDLPWNQIQKEGQPIVLLEKPPKDWTPPRYHSPIAGIFKSCQCKACKANV